MKKINALLSYLLVVILLTTLVSCISENGSSQSGSGQQHSDLSTNNSSNITSEATGTDSKNEDSSIENVSNIVSEQNVESKPDDNSKITESEASETSKAPTPTKTVVGLDAKYNGYNLKIGTKINKADISALLKYSDGTKVNTTDITFTPSTVTKEGENKIKVTSGKHEAEVIVHGLGETENVYKTYFDVTYSGGVIKNGDRIDTSKIKAVITYSDNTTKDVTDQLTHNEHPPTTGLHIVNFEGEFKSVNVPLESSTKQKYIYQGHEYYLRDDGKAVITNFNSHNTGHDIYPDKIDGYIVAELGTEFEFSPLKITIPATIDRIPSAAMFLKASRCQEIVVDENNPYYCTVDGVLYNKDKTIIIRYPVSKEGTTFVIPNSVVAIGDYAFGGCRNLTNVTIPDSVKTIGVSAFSGIQKEGTFVINGGKNVERIASNAFSNSGISDFTINSKVKEIGSGAFFRTKLKSIIIPDNIKSIGCGVFENSYLLETVVFGNQLSYIGVDAFKDCFTLKTINLPSSLTMIDVTAFKNCTSLKNINLPSSLVTIKACAFQNSGLTEITIPDNVKTLGSGVFSDCKSLKSANIGKGINRISPYLFSTCKSLEEVCFNGKILYIMESAFQYNLSLQKIDFPTSVIYIGKNAFAGCISIQTLTIPEGIDIIVERSFEGCSGLKEVKFPSSLRKVSSFAFIRCKGLINLKFPNSIEFIGDYAFFESSSLKTVTIPSSIKAIGEYAFYNCKNLTSFIIEKKKSEVTLGMGWIDVSFITDVIFKK